jgi:hypothetical protein
LDGGAVWELDGDRVVGKLPVDGVGVVDGQEMAGATGVQYERSRKAGGA